MSELADSYGFSQNTFCEFAMQFFRQAGHTYRSEAFAPNNRIKSFIYSIYKPKQIVKPSDWTNLNEIDTISWLFSNGEYFFGNYKFDSSIDYFAIDLNVSIAERSQAVHDVHKILARLTFTPLSVVIFQCSGNCILSWAYRANETVSVVLSDWYTFEDMMSNEVLEQIYAAHLSSNSSVEFFLDFIYGFAREYYIYPESHEYGLFRSEYEQFDTAILPHSIIKQVAEEYYMSPKDKYQLDYVDSEHQDEEEEWFSTDDIDMDMVLLELDIDMKDFSDPDTEDIDDLDEDEYLYEPADDYSEIDIDVFNDPIKMLKWLRRTASTKEEQTSKAN